MPYKVVAECQYSDMKCFKSGDRTIPSNYCPSSITSDLLLSSFFVIIICKQMVAFLISKGYLNPTRHGFRGERSCLSALLNVFNDIMPLGTYGRSLLDGGPCYEH